MTGNGSTSVHTKPKSTPLEAFLVTILIFASIRFSRHNVDDPRDAVILLVRG